jgi:hypothetical protein
VNAELCDALDKAAAKAASLIDCEDADDDESYWSLADERRHCGVCIVAVVMREIVPVLDEHL